MVFFLVALSAGVMADVMEISAAVKMAAEMVEQTAVLWEILLAGGKDVDLAGGSVVWMVAAMVVSLVSGKVASMVASMADAMAATRAVSKALPTVGRMDGTRVVMTACSAVVAKGDWTEDATDDETAEATAGRKVSRSEVAWVAAKVAKREDLSALSWVYRTVDGSVGSSVGAMVSPMAVKMATK